MQGFQASILMYVGQRFFSSAFTTRVQFIWAAQSAQRAELTIPVAILGETKKDFESILIHGCLSQTFFKVWFVSMLA